MQNEPDPVDSVDSTETAAATEESLNAVLEAAQQRLRDVLEQATSTVRHDVESAASAVAQREAEIAERQASLTEEGSRLEAERADLAERIAAVNELRTAADTQLKEAAELNDQAAGALADALERSASVVEEAQARIRADESTAKAQREAELLDARNHAAEIHAQATKRLEAAGLECEAMLKQAVDRGLGIVSIAQASADQSKADLRQVVERIEEYLRQETSTDLDLEAELDIDLRSSTDSEDTDESEPANVAPLLGQVDESGEQDEPLRAAEAVAQEESLDAYFDASVTVDDGSTEDESAEDESTEDESAEDESTEDDADDQRVANAVRRAVRGWSSARQEAQ